MLTSKQIQLTTHIRRAYKVVESSNNSRFVIEESGLFFIIRYEGDGFVIHKAVKDHLGNVVPLSHTRKTGKTLKAIMRYVDSFVAHP